MDLKGPYYFFRAVRWAMMLREITQSRASRGISKFERQMRRDFKKFFKHADKCDITNYGGRCETCVVRSMQYLGSTYVLDNYTAAVRRSPEVTIRPISSWWAHRQAIKESIQEIQNSFTDEQFEEMGLEVLKHAGVDLANDYKFEHRGGAFHYLGFMVKENSEDIEYVIPIYFDEEEFIWVADEPFMSKSSGFAVFYGDDALIHKNYLENAIEYWSSQGHSEIPKRISCEVEYNHETNKYFVTLQDENRLLVKYLVDSPGWGEETKFIQVD